MNALKSLFDDPKGLVALALISAATVLVALSKMAVDQWTNFAVWIFGIFAGATAIHGGLTAIGHGPPAPAPAAATAPAAAPAPAAEPAK